MKTKYPSIFGLLAALMLVASFVVPVNLASPSAAQADPGICKWDTLTEPGSRPGNEVIAQNTDGIGLAVGSDGRTLVAVMKEAPPGFSSTTNVFKFSDTEGLLWTDSRWLSLTQEPQWTTGDQVIDVAMAPDNPQFYAVTATFGGPAGVFAGPREVWVTQNGGSDWQITNLHSVLPAGESIRCIDISVDYGNKRDIVVGTVSAAGVGDLYVVKSTSFTSWIAQNTAASLSPLPPTLAPFNFMAVKFSPSYASDASLAVVFASTDANAGGAGATWYNVGLRDINQNTTPAWAFTIPGIEVKGPSSAANSSPSADFLRQACLQLPSDFSGQAAALRRAYISLDTMGAAGKATSDRDGIFRIDDTTVSTLMDTSNSADKSIFSIAYFGTYASGKLMAGEHMGYGCTATVPTWFTDSPATCGGSCWYPALKPTTGAACSDNCSTTSKAGVGAAKVAWNSQGTLAYVLTGSASPNSENTTPTWYLPLIASLAAPAGLDESALAISRDNGETWNQISLIDTLVYKFTDIAPAPDCKTIYLASVNNTSTVGCCAFDSVWRTSSSPDVVSPLPALPVGTFWERVFTHTTSASCNLTQTDMAILRVVPYCTDPTGQIVGWAVYDPTSIGATGVMAWSPDFGNYWAMITPRHPVQDFCFESWTVMYVLSPNGLVQKLPYTGTAWSTTLPSVDSIIYSAHSIAAFPEGRVLVGADHAYHSSLYAVSYCLNFNIDNPSFTMQSLAGRTPFQGDVHVAFDTNFSDTNIYFANDEFYTGFGGTQGGSVYRNNPQAQLRWSDTDMLGRANGAVGCFHYGDPQTGLALGFTGGALYSSYWNQDFEMVDGVLTNTDNRTGVYRTIPSGRSGKNGPLSGMPKPGIAWDNLTQGLDRAPVNVAFTLQPTALKACGCCTLDTDTTLYAIDNRPYVPGIAGLIWAFTDCMAKRGPALITEDKALIGCDPVSGRAQEVNLCWEQLCVANGYDIEIGKDAAFTIKVIDWVGENNCSPAAFLTPASVTQPCAYFPAGGEAYTLASAIAVWGNLECGHTYYWRVKARACATGQVIRSPWSEVRSFTVKAGLPVVSTYLGLQLLAPNNGCLGCPVQPVSFSWSPYKETTKYKFDLATDTAMTQIVQEAETTTTAFEYDGKLNYSTNYFWRVMSEEPAPSDWSATFSFQTEAKPAAAAGPVQPAPTPVWVWVVIAIGAILVIVTLVLIFKTRRV